MNITKFIKKITMSTMSDEKALEILVKNQYNLESLGDTDTITELINKAVRKDFKRVVSILFYSRSSTMNNLILQLKRDPKVMLYAVKQDPNNLNFADDKVLTEEIIKAALDAGYKFSDLSSVQLRRNEFAMLHAVKQDPNNLNYVSDLILTDEMIDIALSTGNYVFDAKEASGKLKQNSKVMLDAVKQDPNNLNYALAEALTDEMIDIALSSEKYIFDGKVASYALRCNSRVMLYAIKQDPNSLNYVPKEALTDEIIDIALSTGNYVFDDKEASYKLKQNPKVMMYAVKQEPNNLNYVSDFILTDEMIDIALSTGNYVFDAKEASGKLKQNSKVMLDAVKQDPNNLNYALAEALTDEMIDIALSSEKYIFDGKVASYALRCNSRVMLYAIKQDPNSLNYVPKEALTDEIIDIALSTGNYVFDDKEASYKLKQNPKVMMYAVKQDPNNLNYVSDFILTDEIIKAAYDNGFWDLKNNNKNNEAIPIIIAKLRKMIELKHYQNKNTDKMIEHIKKRFFDLTEDKIAELYSLYKRSELTNSEEAYKLRDQIIDGALEQDDPLEVFAKIEKIFEKNNLPLFAKIYKCFETLYPNFNKSTFNFDKNSRISPDLLNANPLEKRMAYLRRNSSDRDIRMQMVFNDLLRISISSADRSLIDYMNNIKVGNDLYLDIVSCKRTFESLTFEEKNILDVFSYNL